jgi:hypothetical protein
VITIKIKPIIPSSSLSNKNPYNRKNQEQAKEKYKKYQKKLKRKKDNQIDFYC